MVDNKDLQQINSWTGGLNLDTSDQFLPSESYREAMNLRLTADTNGNTGTLHNIEGVKLYQHVTTNLPVLTGGKVYSNIHIVHTDSIRQYGIVVVKATIDVTEYYYIFRFINKAELAVGESGTPKLIFGPCPTTLGETLSSVTRYEDDDNVKFYFADGTKPIRSLNISPAIDSTRPMLDDGSFSIYPTALLSQPEFVTLGSGNLKAGAYQYGYQLFTKNGAETEISPLTGLIYTTGSSITPDTADTVKGSNKGDNTNKSIQIKIKINDVKYDRIRIISVFYEDTTSVPSIQVLGDLKLEYKYDGTIDPVYYQDINNLGISTMTTEEFNMITSVHFVPKLLETKNNHLFASDIQYQDNSFDVNYDARAYSYAITSTGDYMAVLNNNDGTNKIIANRNDILNGTVTIPEEHDCINPFSIIEKSCSSFVDTYTTDMNTDNLRCSYVPYNSQILWGGDGKNISWRFTVADLDELTDGSVLIENAGGYYGVSGSRRGAVRRDFEGMWSTNVSNTGKLVNPKFFRLSDTVKTLPCNYSNPIIASKVRSLQRDEVYRYGIVLYNKYNQVSPVKWIADIRTPDAGKLGFESFIANRVVSFREDKLDYRRSALVIRPLGIEFVVKNLPTDVVSYEIVRCRRTDSDRATITQGVIGAVNYPSVQPSSNAMFPNQLMMCTRETIQNQDNTSYNDITVKDGDNNDYGRRMSHTLLNFTSPEICYNNASIRDSLPKKGLKLSMVKFLYGNTSSRSIAGRGGLMYVGGTDNAEIGRIDKVSRLLIDRYEAFVPYFYTPQRLYQYYIQMYEQSNSCNVTNGIESSTNWSGSGTTGYESNITDIVFPTETSWKDYRSKLDFIDGAGAFTYTDWVVTGFNNNNNAYSVNDKLIQGPHGRSIVLAGGPPINMHPGSNPIGPMIVTGERIQSNGNTVLSDIIETTLGGRASYYSESAIGTQLCNLRKSIVPYNGYNNTAKQFNTYISIGGFSVKSTSIAANEHTIFGGDVYINRFKFVNLHYFAGINEDGSVGANSKLHVTYDIPVESVINLAYTNGADMNVYSQIDPANVNGKYVQDKPLYVYNSIYSVEPYARMFTPETIYDEWNKHVDVRTYFSLGKSNDENIDQWTKFQPLNYLDVDTRYGSINNIRTFGNELIYWQSNAVGKFSVNERTLINDNSNQPLMLGTGGVLSRYDYIATVNGLKDGHNDSDCQSDNVLYWYDYDKHELCAYSQGNVVCISKVKNVQSYLNNLSLLTTEQANKPMCTYDKYYNEMIATLSKNESIVYNENMQMFTGFYSLVPDYNMYFNTDVYFTKGQDLYKYNDNVSNNGFDNMPLPIRLKYIVNKDYLRTKVFDNIEFTGYLNKSNIHITYEADSVSSKDLTNTLLTDRENNFRAAIPRANTTELFANRLRGRVLYCNLSYTLGSSESNNIVTNVEGNYVTTITNSDYIVTNNVQRSINQYGVDTNIRFELPYMRTTYRVSKS